MSGDVHVRFCESRGVRLPPATHLVILVKGTRLDAEAIREGVGRVLAKRLKMILSVEKTGGGGRSVVLTFPSKAALAAVMHKVKEATGRGTTSLRLQDVLRVVNAILRGWAAYFRHGVSKKTFAYLGWYAWWRLVGWIRRKHPKLGWKQIRRRFYGADRITEAGVTLYNPAKMQVLRYRFRGDKIGTPCNVDQVEDGGPRFRRTNHDDVGFVGRVSELVSSVST